MPTNGFPPSETIPVVPRLETGFRAQLAALLPGERTGILLAVSGGPDSMALLALCARLPRESPVVVAHLDHALRPGSDQDALFVADQAGRFGFEIVTARIPVRREPGTGGIEAAARRIRYRFLEDTATRFGLTVVATGHHRDDQAETVLLRILRGTGEQGLTGIAPSRPISAGSRIQLIRPLLTFSRAEILEWLAGGEVPFRRDPTNEDGSNLRSRIRRVLLPALAPVPDLAPRLAALAETTRRLLLSRTLDAPRRAGEIEWTPDLRLPSLLRAALRSAGVGHEVFLSRAALARVSAAAQAGGGTVNLPLGYRVIVREGLLRVVPSPSGPPPAPPEGILPCPGRLVLPGGTLTCRREDDAEPDGDPDREVIDLDRAVPPYEVRGIRRGDRFRPLGLGAETKIARFLLKQKVPLESRKAIPLVVSGGVPVWVGGIRLDERAAVDQRTKRRAVLTWRRNPAPR